MSVMWARAAFSPAFRICAISFFDLTSRSKCTRESTARTWCRDDVVDGSDELSVLDVDASSALLGSGSGFDGALLRNEPNVLVSDKASYKRSE